MHLGLSLLIGRSVISNGLFMAWVERFKKRLDEMVLQVDEMVLH